LLGLFVRSGTFQGVTAIPNKKIPLLPSFAHSGPKRAAQSDKCEISPKF
jgi:hypothetical protein